MPIGVIRWQTNEAVRIAEKRLIEEKVLHLHTMAQKKGLSSTGEVIETGGIRTKMASLNTVVILGASLFNV